LNKFEYKLIDSYLYFLASSILWKLVSPTKILNYLYEE